MKRIFLSVLIAITATTLIHAQHQSTFKEDFIAYKASMDELSMTVQMQGDTAYALDKMITARTKLSQWAMEMEQQYEAKWPGWPANGWCVLNCVYRSWRCTNVIGEDFFYCLMEYDYCMEECKRSVFIPNNPH